MKTNGEIFPVPCGQAGKMLGSFVLGAAIFATDANGQSAYSLEVLVKTGDRTPAGNVIVALGGGPSINDAGKVAYSLRVQDGREGVYVSGEGASRSSLIENFPVTPGSQMLGLASNFTFPAVVQINNQNRVAWHVRSKDGLFSFVFRLGTTSADFRIVAKTWYDRVETTDVEFPSPFLGPGLFPSYGLYSWISLNNSGRTVFSGILRADTGLTVLASPLFPDTGGHASLSDYEWSEALGGYPDLFAVVSDDNKVLARFGDSASDPLYLFTDQTFAAADIIGDSAVFSSMGQKPGLSDNGRVAAFAGDHRTLGRGIFGWSDYIRFKISGISEDGQLDLNETFDDENRNGRVDAREDHGFFTEIPLDNRVAVNRSSAPNQNTYTVAFLARGTVKSSLFSRPLGLYTVHVDVSDPERPIVSRPAPVLEQGDMLPGLNDPVDSISTYDPLNATGQLAFWVRTRNGTQAIVRATPGNRPVVVLVRGLHVFWEGIFTSWSSDARDYWADAIKYLGERGFEVWACDTISGTHSIAEEARQLDRFIQSKLLERRMRGQLELEHVSVVAHSYGGLVTRYYLNHYPHVVNKVVMLSAPNCGSKAAEVGLGWLGRLTEGLNRNRPALENLTRDYVQYEFNPAHPDPPPGVQFYLFGGTGGNSSEDFTLRGMHGQLLHDPTGTTNPNDGAVTVDSAQGWRWSIASELWEYPNRWEKERQIGLRNTWTGTQCAEDHTTITQHPFVLDSVHRALTGGWLPPSEESPGATCLTLPFSLQASSSASSNNAMVTVDSFGGLLSSGSSTQLSVHLTSSSQASFDLLSASTNLQIRLISPGGGVMVPGGTNTNLFAYGTNRDAGNHFGLNVNSPTGGLWQVVLSNAPSVTNLTPVPWALMVAEESNLNAENATEFFQATTPIVLRLAIAPRMAWTTAVVTVEITDPNGGTTEAAIFDDGAHSDLVAGDGVFAGSVPDATNAGLYSIRFHVEGQSGIGEIFSRVATGMFQIAPRTVTLGTQNWSTGLDLGPPEGFEALLVQTEVQVMLAGRYSLTATLADQSGRGIATTRTSAVHLLPGVTNLALEFPGSAIRRANVNGPFQLLDVCLWDESGDRLLKSDYAATAPLQGDYESIDFSETGTAGGVGPLSIYQAGSGGVRVTWAAHRGARYTVEKSSDLVTWWSVATKFADALLLEYLEPSDVLEGPRFYRVRINE